MANDVFLRVFTHLGSFRGDEDQFRSWAFTIAHNLLVDERRRGDRRPLLAGEPLDEHQSERSTEAEAFARMGTEQVERLLQALSPDQRDVLLLRIVADLTVEQVAQTLGKPPGAVKQLQRRGLAALRRRLGQADDDDGPDQEDPGRTLSAPAHVHRRR